MATENNIVTASVSFHFTGPIVEPGHKLTLRTLGKTTSNLQNAIERAYLDQQYGTVYKYQRLQKKEYEDIEFVAQHPQEGGFILDAISKAENQIARATIDRLYSAIKHAFDRSSETAQRHISFAAQAEQRAAVYKQDNEAQDYRQFVESELDQLNHAYGNRSINKELDQILSLIREAQHQGSTFEISTHASTSNSFLFDAARAQRFHTLVSERRIGTPLTLQVELRSLDAGRGTQWSKGKARNIITGKEFNMDIPNARTFGKLTKYLRKKNKKQIEIIACPVYEFDAWDPQAGDVVVIDCIGEINV